MTILIILYCRYAPLIPTAYTSDLTIGLAAGGTLSIIGTIDITFPSSDCGSVQYLCGTVMAGADAEYTDVDLNNNMVCFDAASFAQCPPGNRLLIIYMNYI